MDNLEKDLIKLKDEEVRIPKCVSNKIDDAFLEIRKDKKKKKYFLKRKGIVAVAVIIIIFVMTPDARAAISSFISKFTNPGIVNAEMNNYIQPINDIATSTDKIDIKLNNIMVDSSKIILDYEVNFKADNIDLNKFEYYFSSGDISLWDENAGNPTLIGGGIGIFEKDGIDSKKGHYRVMYKSNEANIPKINKLNIKFKHIKISNPRDEIELDETFNWDSTVVLDDKFNNYKTIEYKWNNSENIKVYKAESLPTGMALEFLYSAKGREYMDDICNMKLLTEDGKEYSLSSASVDGNEMGDRYSVLFNGVTSFEDINKFTLEIKNPKLGTVDRIEFTK